MIAYLDTAAFVPVLVSEPTSKACRRIWDDADAVVSSRLLYVETAAALAQAERMHRLTAQQHASCQALLDEIWPEIAVVEVDEAMVFRAAALSREFALRGYDSVHAASAEQLDDTDVVAVSGDSRLLVAWAGLGLATFDTNAPT